MMMTRPQVNCFSHNIVVHFLHYCRLRILSLSDTVSVLRTVAMFIHFSICNVSVHRMCSLFSTLKQILPVGRVFALVIANGLKVQYRFCVMLSSLYTALNLNLTKSCTFLETQLPHEMPEGCTRQ
jgi:hypothetical protein